LLAALWPLLLGKVSAEGISKLGDSVRYGRRTEWKMYDRNPKPTEGALLPF
jgi:hypothetical protein